MSQSIQPPAIPLAVRSPYLQSYLPHTSTTEQSNLWPNFWTTNHILGCTGLVRVDNALYTWLGQPGSLMLNNGTKLNNAAFNGYQVTPTRSILRLTAGNMNINASSNDENSHSVQVYQDITGEWLSKSNDVTNIMQRNTTAVQNTTTLYHEAQRLPFQFIEENDMAEDGVVYHVTNTLCFWSQGSAVTYESGEDTILRRSGFLKNGTLPNTQDTMNRAISEQANFLVLFAAVLLCILSRWPVLAFSSDLRNITSTSTSSPLVWGIGLVRSPDIIYATTTGNQTRRPYFFTKYGSGGVPAAMVDFMSDAQNALQRSINLDNALLLC
ncbi:hypothetical protein D9757_005949 [Collybiopsis confluens]|uniref:Glutaminase A N-terminal domain-containing protein n=1 Tax=Collybiopsis confluens TaxID=2823264 RepID=A0A8H5HU92_9AGAR|nr:hypothetical protein D9757_005949 [Collybiopsis confluens]